MGARLSKDERRAVAQAFSQRCVCIIRSITSP